MRAYLTLSAAVLALSAAACPADDAEQGSVLTLRRLASRLEARRSATGAYPATLPEVCIPGGCPGIPPGTTPRDGWERPILYAPSADAFELRSAGRDGRPGTADDLTVSPRAELRRRALFAGCYRLSPPLAGRAGVVRLDTVPASETAYAVRAEGDLSNVEWHPLSDSTAVVVWAGNPHRHTVIEFRPAPGGLAGRQVNGGSGVFTAAREDCP